MNQPHNEAIAVTAAMAGEAAQSSNEATSRAAGKSSKKIEK